MTNGLTKREKSARLANGSNGRDHRGRFTHGNPGGPGNPNAAAVGAWRSALVKTVTLADFEEVVRKLVDLAKAGEPWAVRELLNRCLGRPTQAVSIESEPLTLAQVIKVLRAKVDDGEESDIRIAKDPRVN